MFFYFDFMKQIYTSTILQMLEALWTENISLGPGLSH